MVSATGAQNQRPGHTVGRFIVPGFGTLTATQSGLVLRYYSGPIIFYSLYLKNTKYIYILQLQLLIIFL